MSEKVVDGAFAYGKLEQQGNFWFRSVQSVPYVLASEKPLRVFHREPPPLAAKLNNLKLEFFVARPFARDGKPPSQRRISLDEKKRIEHMKICNGNPFDPTPVHYCHPVVGCLCGLLLASETHSVDPGPDSPHLPSDVRIIKRYAASIVALGYRKKPPVPAVKEFTKVAEAMNNLAFSMNSNGIAFAVYDCSVKRIQPHAFPHALRELGLSLQLMPAADLSKASQGVTDYQDLEGVDWHALVGRRVKYVSANLMNYTALLSVTLLAVLVGAEETISKKLFSGTVKLADTAYLPRNPALPVMQFFSSILAQEHDVILLLCGAAGCHTADAVNRTNPKAAHLIRCATVGSSAATHLRHIDRAELWPTPLAVIGSPDVPEEIQLDVAQRFCRRLPCDLDAGMGQVVYAQAGHNVEALYDTGILSPFWRRALFTWASFHDQHTFDLECGFAHTKKATHLLNKWDLISARCVNRNAKQAMPAICADSRIQPTQLSILPPLPSPVADSPGADSTTPLPLPGADPSSSSSSSAPPPPPPPPVRFHRSRGRSHKSALQLYHKKCSQRDSKLGVLHISPLSSTYWERVRALTPSFAPSSPSR